MQAALAQDPADTTAVQASMCRLELALEGAKAAGIEKPWFSEAAGIAASFRASAAEASAFVPSAGGEREDSEHNAHYGHGRIFKGRRRSRRLRTTCTCGNAEPLHQGRCSGCGWQW